VSQVVLHKLKGAASIEEMRRNRVSKRVAGESAREPHRITVAGEERLNLALSKWALAPWEKRIVVAPRTPLQVPTERSEE